MMISAAATKPATYSIGERISSQVSASLKASIREMMTEKVLLAQCISIVSSSGTASVEIAKDVSAREGLGVRIENGSDNSGVSSVSIGGSLSAGENGAGIVSGSGTATIEIAEDVSVEKGIGLAIKNTSDNSGASSITVGGSLVSGESGIGISNSGGTASITITEGVTAEGEFGAFVANIGGNSETSSLSIGGSLDAGQDGVKMVNYSGDISIDIAEDLNAENGTGITVTNQGPNWANYGTALLTVGGDLTAKNGINVGYNGEGNGAAQVYVAGDLNAADTGIDLGVYTPPTRSGVIGDVLPVTDTDAETDEGEPVPDVDIIVEGTISGSNPIAVNTINAVSSFLVTTWAITPNEGKRISTGLDGNAAEDFEKNNINYIIKKKDSEYGTLSVTGTTAKAVPGVVAGPAPAAGRARPDPASWAPHPESQRYVPRNRARSAARSARRKSR